LAIYPEFTALVFLLYLAALKGIDKKTAKKQKQFSSRSCGTERRTHCKGSYILWGMKQRLGIALEAVLNDRRLLIP
jgi:ABC-2 type transport system ATP-binding protein